MSRLGRNYLQVGFYTEMLFPDVYKRQEFVSSIHIGITGILHLDGITTFFLHIPARAIISMGVRIPGAVALSKA